MSLRAWDVYRPGMVEALVNPRFGLVSPPRIRVRERFTPVERCLVDGIMYSDHIRILDDEGGWEYTRHRKDEERRDILTYREFISDETSHIAQPDGDVVVRRAYARDRFVTGTITTWDVRTNEIVNTFSFLHTPCYCNMRPYPGYCPKHDLIAKRWPSLVSLARSVSSAPTSCVLYTTPHPCFHTVEVVEASKKIFRFSRSHHLSTSIPMLVRDVSEEGTEVRLSRPLIPSGRTCTAEDPFGLRCGVGVSRAPTPEELAAAVDNMLPSIEAKVNLPVFIGELKDLRATLTRIPVVTRLFRRFRENPRVLLKGRKKAACQHAKKTRNGILDLTKLTLGDLAQFNLWYQFGVAATVSDVKQMIQTGLDIPPKILRLLKTRAQPVTSHYRLWDEDTSSLTSAPLDRFTGTDNLPAWGLTQEDFERERLAGRLKPIGNAVDSYQSYDGYTHILDGHVSQAFSYWPGRPVDSGLRRLKSKCIVTMHWNWDVEVPAGQSADEVLYAKVIRDLYGLNLNPNIVWELIPFSFVVDWFLTVGDWLEGFSVKNFSPFCNLIWATWSVTERDIQYERLLREERKERIVHTGPDEWEPFSTDVVDMDSYVDLTRAGRYRRTAYQRQLFTPNPDWLHRSRLRWRLPNLNQMGLGLSLLAK